MLKVNGTVIENVRFNGKAIEKVVINGVTVFEKKRENIVTMRTLQEFIYLKSITKDGIPCEVWNAGRMIGVLQGDGSSPLFMSNKNEDIIIKGNDITELECTQSKLASLNAQGCTALQKLFCTFNQLTSLNVQGCTALQWLDCFYNQLTSLNVQGCTALQKLYCYDNQLTGLNAQGCTALQQLSCSNNKLTNLNVQGLTTLQQLFCSNNKLTNLNVQGLTTLQHLSCSNNKLTSLNVQGCTALQYLDCTGNQLTTQAFTNLFKSLPQKTYASAVLYRDNDNSYKDFSRPPELVQAFNAAKARGWKFYKNNTGDGNLL